MELWIVGRHSSPQDAPLVWEFMGVFESRELALAACTTYRDFIGPTTLNVRMPDETLLWPGIEYPLSPEFVPQ